MKPQLDEIKEALSKATPGRDYEFGIKERIAKSSIEWIAFLLEEYTEERAAHNAHAAELCKAESQLKQLREELKQVKKERDKDKALAYPTVDAYEAACRALDKHRADAESLRAELAEKDKVLKVFENRDNWEEHPLNRRIAWIGENLPWEIARSILSQYATINESTEEP